MKNCLGHNFEPEIIYNERNYFKCITCDIIIYNSGLGVTISQRNPGIFETGRILNISCNEMIIKKLLE